VRDGSRFALAYLLVKPAQSAEFVERTKKGLGLAPPATAGRAVRENVELIWSGPHRWLAIAGGVAEPEWVARLSRVYGGVAGVSPQSSGQVIVKVGGPGAREALSKVCALDLHPSVFRPDSVALTKLSQVAVQLWRVGDGDAFGIAMPRSYAHYLRRALAAASAELSG
jgi:heterotetrameric sarcosine oxidase gamma subunit